MNDLRSPLEDRPYTARNTYETSNTMTTPGYYRARLEAIRQSRWFPLASVLAAVLVFSGIVSYAYQQGSQTGVNATTPIVQASNESYKAKPENPGGMDVPFQDAIVFDQFQNDQQKTTSIESLLPPPEQPVAATTNTPAATAEKTTTAAATTEAQTLDDVVDQVVIQDKPVTTLDTTTTAVAQKEVTPVADAPVAKAPAAQTETKTLAKKMDDVAPASAPATTRIESGSYRIQLGSFRDEAAARSAWKQYKQQFNSQLGSITPDFPRADLGAKGVFYRAQGINLSKASADELCRSINAAKAGSCLVTQ